MSVDNENDNDQEDVTIIQPSLTSQYDDSNDDDSSSTSQSSLQDRLDDFLDRPFFDPDQFDDNDTSFLGNFARLVRNDYELAETLYVGAIFVILIIVTQEVLRAQLFGDAYVPFVKGNGGNGGGGKLF